MNDELLTRIAVALEGLFLAYQEERADNKVTMAKQLVWQQEVAEKHAKSVQAQEFYLQKSKEKYEAEDRKKRAAVEPIRPVG